LDKAQVKDILTLHLYRRQLELEASKNESSFLMHGEGATK
jgi:hypothetical protein